MSTSTSHKHLPVRPEWLALRVEDIIEPDLPILDPHHHLWDNPGERYLLPDLLSDLSTGHNIRATMFMQCHEMYRQDGDPHMRWIGETEFVNGIAAMSASGKYGPAKICAGIIGYADLRLGDKVRPILEAHIAAGGGRFRGIRNVSCWHKDPTAHVTVSRPPEGLLRDPSLRKGVSELTSLGLVFEAFCYHTQIAELRDLARAAPDTTIVANHILAPLGVGPYEGKRKEVFEDWSKAMSELAACPNVMVKLGGMAMPMFGFRFDQQALPPSSEDLAAAWGPYMQHVVSAFGPKRCMFESNFPVDKGGCSYPVLWNAYKRIAAQYSPDEKKALFSDTAARVYRIDLS